VPPPLHIGWRPNLWLWRRDPKPRWPGRRRLQKRRAEGANLVVQGGGGDIGTDQGHTSGGLGAHADGANPATEVSGLTGVRGHSCRGGGRGSTDGIMQGTAGGGTALGTKDGVLRATGALLYTDEDGGMSLGDDVFHIDSGVPGAGTTQGGSSLPAASDDTLQRLGRQIRLAATSGGSLCNSGNCGWQCVLRAHGNGGGLGSSGGILRGDNDVLSKGGDTLGSDLVGASAPGVGNQGSDMLSAADDGCIGAYSLGGDDLGMSLGGSSLGSGGGIVGSSSSVNALLGNIVPLGDGSTDDRAGMEDNMNGAADWRWPASGRRRRPQRGQLQCSGRHRRPAGGALRSSNDKDKVLSECGMCSGMGKLSRDDPNGGTVSPGIQVGGVLAGESGRKDLSFSVHDGSGVPGIDASDSSGVLPTGGGNDELGMVDRGGDMHTESGGSRGDQAQHKGRGAWRVRAPDLVHARQAKDSGHADRA
jgi:hypothetical protein